MSSTYEIAGGVRPLGGTIYCFVLFLGVLVYALWPANGETFKKAAGLPLRED